MTKKNLIPTSRKLTMVVDLLQGSITLADLTPEQNEEMVAYFKGQALAMMRKKEGKKAEPKKAEPKKTPKAPRPKQVADYTELKNEIMTYLQANPNLMCGSTDLCRNIEKFRENGYKFQKLVRPLNQLQEEGKIKVVETKPKKLYQLA